MGLGTMDGEFKKNNCIFYIQIQIMMIVGLAGQKKIIKKCFLSFSLIVE